MRARPAPPLLLLLLGLVLGLVPATGCASTGPRTPRESPPNIVFILADDMGYGDARCFNPDAKIPTPHIDSLARGGMRFTDAHAPGSWCVPSRYGLMTGRYPCRPRNFRPGAGPVIEAERVTVASFLREQGYATAMVGKWHLGFEGGSETDGRELHGGPVDRGFDHFFGIHASLDIPPYYYIDGRTPLAPPTERIGASQTAGWTNIQGAFWREGAIAPGFEHAEVLPRFGQRAAGYIEELAPSEDPFFLYVALAGPHTPWLPENAFAGTSGAGLYGDFVADVDATVGEILAALERTGETRDTLVIFTSDNGPVWYPDDVERFGHSATGPYRGMKSDAWEGGHRMPFVAHWPARIEAGATSAQTICFTDVLPTCADAARAELPVGVAEDGHSFFPILLGASAVSGREVTVLKADASVLRSGPWKLITHLGSGGFSMPRRIDPNNGGPSGQLYHLRTDRGETANLWSERPDVVARLQGLLAPYLIPDPSRRK